MVIKERIAEIEAQNLENAKIATENTQKEEERKFLSFREEQEKQRLDEISRRKLFLENVPAALAEQSKLFTELQDLGVISMIQEMAKTFGPWNIDYYNYEFNPDGNNFVPFPKRAENLLTPADEQSEWMAITNALVMNPDGSVQDSNIAISITHNRNIWDETTPIQSLSVSYTREKVLSIKGAETTFEGRIDTNSVPDIELAIAKAFVKPQEKDPIRLRTPQRGGIRPSRPQPRIRSSA